MSAQLFDALVGDGYFPNTVEVEGNDYPIITDCRHWMRVESVILDGDVPEDDKVIYILSSFLASQHAGIIDLRHGYPFSIEAAMQALMLFYNCGEAEKKPAKAKRSAKRKERSYDFRHDIGLIYAAFRSAYGYDLREDDLHWWMFSALFAGLPEDQPIRNLMQMRGQQPAKPTKEQKQIKDAVALPENIRWFDATQRRPASMEEWAASIRARKEGQ